MEVLLQVLVNSLIVGSIYAMSAAGFWLMYRISGFFNLSYGAVGAVGGYIFLMVSEMGGSMAMAGLSGVAGAGALAWLSDALIFRQQRKKKATGTVLLVASLGLAAMIESLLSIKFGTQFKQLDSLGAAPAHDWAGVFVTNTQLAMIGINIVIYAGLTALLHKTRFGRMVRAIADQSDVARILGIRTDIYIGLAFLLAGMVIGLDGILVGLDTGLQPTTGLYLLLKGVIAAVIGGLARLPGAFLGGFLLALVENTGVYVLASEWRDAIAFAVLLVFLLLRPEGLLTRRKE